jgi:AraC-like DNA-binding protein
MSSPFQLSYFDPPQALSRHVLTTFWFASEQKIIEDRHPGGLGQLVLFIRGDGMVRFGDRTDYAETGPYLFCGFSSAAPIRVAGPWTAVGASLSPLGWAALTGEPARDHIDRFMPASEFLGDAIDEFSAVLRERLVSDEISGEEACDDLARWIGSRLRTIQPAHEKVIETTIGWLGSSLNPELDRLFGELAYSRRQSERLVERYFGLPPAALARKFRALRAAALLAQDDLSDEAEGEIAAAFTDQPHMIREIRRFCGYTPSRLGGPGDPIFHTMIRLKNLDRLKQFHAIE